MQPDRQKEMFLITVWILKQLRIGYFEEWSFERSSITYNVKKVAVQEFCFAIVLIMIFDCIAAREWMHL